MHTGRIQGFTRDLGKPKDWDEARDGICGSLPVRDQPDANGLNYMISAWHPTPDEIERINQGASVLLWVCGSIHPPVMLSVGKVDE